MGILCSSFIARKVNYVDINDAAGEISLLREAFDGRNKKCGKILDRGTNVNIANANHVTALMVAAKFGYADVCQLLLDRGGNPNLGDINEKTSLMLSCKCYTALFIHLFTCFDALFGSSCNSL